MSNGKKQQKKRKRHSSPIKSQIGIRLEKLRGRRKDLWGDDDDYDDDDKNDKKLKITKNNNYKSYIVLSDSDEEKLPSSSSSRQSRSIKSRKKLSHNHVKNATCLICSILSQLSSYNCCSEHLSILKNQQQAATTITNFQCLPEKVMILPLTDEIVQRYLDPQHIHHLRTSTSSINKKNLSQISFNKSTMTSDHSESEQLAKPLASTIIVESIRSNSATIPPDITISTAGPSTSVINNVETVTLIDIDQSSIQTIPIDDTQQENILIKSNNKQIDPWIPISDEIDAALEQALDQIDSSPDTSLEFTPATVRRTETEFMAAHLPKIPLKQGRFRQGKPIIDRTTSNAANEYRPLAAAQSSPITSSAITTNILSPPTTTNVEKELNQSENTIDNHNDNLLTQDEIDSLSTITRTNTIDIEINRSNETQRVSSSTTKDKTTPSRISFRMNPDGTRVSISRPPLPTNHQSPLINALRRTSTDVTPIQPNTKQV